MKKKSFWSRMGDFLMGKGFYMVLLLCVMAIGGSGYYLYHLASTELDTSGQAVSAPAEVEVETQPVYDPEVTQELADALAQAEAEAQAASEISGTAETATEQAGEADAAEANQETAQPVEEALQPEEDAAEEAAAEATAEETLAQEPAEETGSSQTFVSPVSGQTVAAFSDSELTYNPTMGDWRTHNGVDLSAELGDEVAAVLDGEVLSVTEDVLLGTTITLNHGDGLMTVYGNLAPDVAVEQGDAVTAGQTIGAVGETAAGEENEGAWLHFAVQKDGQLVDPMDYLE